MERESLDSTCIRSVGYDGVARELEVEFTDGTIYTYYGVHVFTYSNLIRALSPGWYFNKYIRDSHAFSG